VLTNATGGPSGTLTSAVPSVGQTITSSTPCAGPNNAQGILKTLEQVGLVHMLAEPTSPLSAAKPPSSWRAANSRAGVARP